MYANWKQVVGDPLFPKDWPPRARVGINGFGAIARRIIRCALIDNRGIDIVAINASGYTPELMVYLTKYDTDLGPFKGCISEHISYTPANKECDFGEYCTIEIGGRNIGVFHYEDISQIPWHWLNVEYVIETTGKIKHLNAVTQHLVGGRARKVLVVGDMVDIPLLMYPINCRCYEKGTSIVASGSAMSHAVATLLSAVDAGLDLVESMFTLVLPMSAEGNVVDGTVRDSKNWRLGRGAPQNIIPGRCTEVIQSVIQALPKMARRVNGITMHVPTCNGAMVDLTCRLKDPIENQDDIIERITDSKLMRTYNSIYSLCQLYHKQSRTEDRVDNDSSFTKPMTYIMDTGRHDTDQSDLVSYESTQRNEKTGGIKIPDKVHSLGDPNSIFYPLKGNEAFVSSDAIGKHSLCLLNVDCTLCLTDGNILKVVSWFDPTTSFCERVLDTLVYMRDVDHT